MTKFELRKQMHEMGLNYKQLAEKLGYSPVTISNYLWDKKKKPSELFILKFKQLKQEVNDE